VVNLARVNGPVPTAESIRERLRTVPAELHGPWRNDWTGIELAEDIREALATMTELNTWVVLAVVQDVTRELPTGPAATRILRRAWDGEQGTFRFEASS
jgi:hypothetical protein